MDNMSHVKLTENYYTALWNYWTQRWTNKDASKIKYLWEAKSKKDVVKIYYKSNNIISKNHKAKIVLKNPVNIEIQ